MGTPPIIFQEKSDPPQIKKIAGPRPPKYFFCPEQTPPIILQKKPDPPRIFLFAGPPDRQIIFIRAFREAGMGSVPGACCAPPPDP